MGELPRHERVATAQIEDLCGIRAAVNGSNQLFDILLGERQQQVFVDDPVAAEASQHPHGGLVVDQLSVACAKDDGHRSVDAHPRDVVEELRRRIITPMDVVEQEQGRGLGPCSDCHEVDHGSKQAVAARCVLRRVAELGEERRECGAIGFRDDIGRQSAKRIDPRSIRTTCFRFVRGRLKDRTSPPTRLVTELCEKPSFADAGFPFEHEDGQAFLT
jgi:hypothetical protein